MKSNWSHAPSAGTVDFGANANTAGAIGQYLLFILVVSLLYFVFGAFEDPEAKRHRAIDACIAQGASWTEGACSNGQ